MIPSGYSGKQLFEKLGIKPGLRLLVVNEPADYLSLLGLDASAQACKKGELPEMIHVFVEDARSFEKEMKKIKVIAGKNSSVTIWVSWYKKSSGIKTDITEDTIRNYALQNNLVDVKVCAVSEIWSGLKLVVPLAKRK